MAPEMLRGEVPTVKYDIWSFGVILFLLFKWENLFKGSFNKVIEKI